MAGHTLQHISPGIGSDAQLHVTATTPHKKPLYCCLRMTHPVGRMPSCMAWRFQEKCSSLSSCVWRRQQSVHRLAVMHTGTQADLCCSRPLLKLPTSRSILLLTSAPEDSTSSSMALVHASSSERLLLTGLPPWDMKNSTALPSRGPLPIFSLQPQHGL